MFFKLWSLLTFQKVVYLLDFDGEVTKTVAKKTPFGYVAKRWWPFTHAVCLLKDDGTVFGKSYVTHWKE